MAVQNRWIHSRIIAESNGKEKKRVWEKNIMGEESDSREEPSILMPYVTI